MGIASNIISVIIKSTVNNKLGDGLGSKLIGISIDECSDKGINKIKELLNEEKSKIEHIFSKENMKAIGVSEKNINFVIAEIKELLSKIDITDELFRKCRYNHEYLAEFLWNEYNIYKNIIENENDIKKVLYVISKTLIELMLRNKEFEKYFFIQISNSTDDIKAELKKIFDYMNEHFNELDNSNKAIVDILQIILLYIQKSEVQKKDRREKIQSRTKEYYKKWNNNMFLNDFDKRDKKAGINVKLREVYLEEHLPHYKWNSNEEYDNDLKDLITEYICDKKEKKMLLILGQPGIGKSTLITWIIANFMDIRDGILVYQFASDIRKLHNYYLDSDKKKLILGELKISLCDLEGKIVFLDGFDEIDIKEDREKILNGLYMDLIESDLLNKFSLIITCRENYIQDLDILMCDYIVIQAWDSNQIMSFCSIFSKITNCNISKETIQNILKNKNILGIPLILYMVLALEIPFEEGTSIVDIYDRIFSLEEGGIYERCFRNLRKNKLERYGEPHWIYILKNQIHQISKEIAIWMFENNSQKASIPKEKYKEICRNVMYKSEYKNKSISQNFMIGGFFKLVRHCEGLETEELHFVHRTIYEYFVAEAFYDSIKNTMTELSNCNQKKLAGNIAVYLSKRKLTKTITDYFVYKIMKIYNALNKDNKKIFFQWWEGIVEGMMENGMFYYTEQPINNFKNIIRKEMQCFMNLLEILRKMESINVKKYIIRDTKNLRKYMEFCCVEFKEEIKTSKIQIDFSKINLSNADLKRIILSDIKLNGVNLRKAKLMGADLSGTNLRGADLRETNLSGADLREANLMETNLVAANLRGANLIGAKLIGADLSEVDLIRTNLIGVNLSGAKLRGADLRGADLEGADVRGANLRGADLRDLDLRGANLIGVNLSGAKLRGADLRGVDLSGVNLEEADLREVDLRKTKLERVNLVGARLLKAIFDEEQVSYLVELHDLYDINIYIKKINKEVTYEEYCRRKNEFS